MLDVRDRQVVIIGGGKVAARKARRLVKSGATRVRVVAPVFDPEMPADVERVAAPYDPRYIESAQLVFAATDSPRINAAVVHDAQALGAWVNRVDFDDGPPGDFTLPAIIEDGPITVGVACGSPALSRRISRRLASRIDPNWTRFAAVLARLRPSVRDDSRLSPQQRREILLRMSSDEALDAFIAGGVAAMIAQVRAACPQWQPDPIG